MSFALECKQLDAPLATIQQGKARIALEDEAEKLKLCYQARLFYEIKRRSKMIYKYSDNRLYITNRTIYIRTIMYLINRMIYICYLICTQ